MLTYQRAPFEGGVKYHCHHNDVLVVITGTYKVDEIETNCVSWHVSITNEKFHSLDEAKERIEELLV